MKPTIFLLFLLFLPFSSYSSIEGHYQAKFTTLNPHINGTIPGSVNFYRLKNQVYAYVRLFAGGVKSWHMQNVYEGSRCPTAADDANLDGIIDIEEAELVLGKRIIPLDGNISSQRAGKNFYPTGDLAGSYHYEKLASHQKLMKDLRATDPDPGDDLMKLEPGENLNLGKRAVLIQGVAKNVNLPGTVASKGPYASYKTLPIACGLFRRISSK